MGKSRGLGSVYLFVVKLRKGTIPGVVIPHCLDRFDRSCTPIGDALACEFSALLLVSSSEDGSGWFRASASR